MDRAVERCDGSHGSIQTRRMSAMYRRTKGGHMASGCSASALLAFGWFGVGIGHGLMVLLPSICIEDG